MRMHQWVAALRAGEGCLPTRSDLACRGDVHPRGFPRPSFPVNENGSGWGPVFSLCVELARAPFADCSRQSSAQPTPDGSLHEAVSPPPARSVRASVPKTSSLVKGSRKTGTRRANRPAASRPGCVGKRMIWRSIHREASIDVSASIQPSSGNGSTS